MEKGLDLWGIWLLQRRPRADLVPHQLGGVLGLLGAKDELELF